MIEVTTTDNTGAYDTGGNWIWPEWTYPWPYQPYPFVPKGGEEQEIELTIEGKKIKVAGKDLKIKIEDVES